MSYSAPNGRGAIKSGWRKPAVVWGTHLQVICEKSRTSFDRPNTRRADARRSRGHAYVHRKNRFFVGGHSHGNRRAGGVSPPWGAFDANAKRGNSSHCSCRRGLTNTTAGSRPPLLWACVCTSQMSYSAPNGRGAIKSGWRKPAVVWGTHLQVICEKSRTSFDRPNTRRADARRSCSSVASSSNGGRFSPHRVRFTDHGGLTPAALVRASRRRRMVGDFRRTAFGLPTTAG
jgi:hypothetical protein